MKKLIFLLISISVFDTINAQSSVWEAKADSILSQYSSQDLNQIHDIIFQVGQNNRDTLAVLIAEKSLLLAKPATSLDTGLVIKIEAFSAYYKKDFKTAVNLFKIATPYFRQAESWRELENTYRIISYAFENMHEQNYDSVLFWTKKAQSISNKDLTQLHINNCNIGYAYQRLGLLDSAEFMFKKCLDLKRKYSPWEEVLGAFGNLQYIYEITHRPESKYELIIDEIAYFDSLGNDYAVAIALFDQAKMMQSINDPQTISTFKKAIERGQTSKNHYVITRSYISIAEILKNHGNYEEALAYYNSALQISEKHHLIRSTAYAQASLSEYYSDLKDHDLAVKYITMALSANQESDYNHQKPYLLLSKARVDFARGHNNSALEALNEGIQIAEELTNTTLDFELTQLKILILLQQKDIVEYDSLLLNFENIANKLNGDDHKKLYLETMYAYYIQKENFKAANTILLDLQSLTNKINIKELNLQALILNASFDLEQKEKENMILKLKSGDQERKIQSQKIIIVIVIVGMLLLGILSFRLMKSKQLAAYHTRTLEALNIELNKANAHKEQIIKIISHDLRGPISSYSYAIKFIESAFRKKKYDSMGELITMIKKQNSVLFNTLDNLLHWVISQKHIGKIELKSLDLIEITNQAVDLAMVMAQQKQITIDRELPDQAFVVGEQGSIELVFRNILGNAVKFTPNKGTISMKLIDHPNEIECVIMDSGVGMTPSQIKSIINQSMESTYGTNQEKGSGLGLSLCISYLKQNNSELIIQSAPGEGTSFSFKLSKPSDSKSM